MIFFIKRFKAVKNIMQRNPVFKNSRITFLSEFCKNRIPYHFKNYPFM